MRRRGTPIAPGLIALVALIVTLVACDGQLPGLGGPPPTVAPTAGSAPGDATPTTQPTPTVAVATATIAPTPHPTITPGPSPTPEPAALLAAAVEPRLNAVLPAPDGSRRAEVIRYDCAAVGDDPGPRALEILRIVEPAAETEYQLASQLLYCEGLGAFGLEPLAWGESGRIFWYTTEREGQPDGGCRPWVRSATRVDLADWSLTPLGQAVASPDGTKVAGWLNGELVVYALDGGQLGRSAPPALPPHVGPPVWSPDGSALAYLQFTSFCGETPGESALVLVDGATFEPRVLATQTNPEFESVGWPEPGRLSLAGLQGGEQWVYDLESGQLAPAP